MNNAGPFAEHADERERQSKHCDDHSKIRRSSRIPVLALLAVLLATLLGIKLMNLPLNRMLELRYCVRYYQSHDSSKIPPNGDIPEKDCKLDAVQAKLGWIMGAFDTTVQACDLTIATPMGYLADRFGCRFILFLNCMSTMVLLLWITVMGHFQSIPPATILVGPFLSIFGGGNNVFKSVSVALLSDLAQTDVERTSNISYFLSTDYITMLIGPMLAAIMMPYGLSLPLWTGLILIAAALPLLGFVPSKRPSGGHHLLRVAQDTDADRQESTPLFSDQFMDAEDGREPVSSQRQKPLTNFLAEYLNLLKASKKFRLLLLAKFLSSFASSSSSLLALYITMRTGWTFAEVGYMYTFKGIINIFLAVIAVPACSHYFGNRSSIFVFNLTATKLALLTSIVGATMVALSSNSWQMTASLCIYALGSVLPIFMYAIARSSELGILNDSNEGSGFTILVVVQAIGGLLGAPTMAAVWVQAIGLRGHGLGLPYFVSAMAYGVALMVMLLIKE